MNISKRPASVFCICLVIALTSPLISQAADISYDDEGGCTYTLTGIIADGDSVELFTLTNNRPFWGGVLCLNSEGGSYLEAMKLADIVSEDWITTAVRRGASCLSACGLVFLAGSTNTESGAEILVSRYLHPQAQLGFHAPYIPTGTISVDDAAQIFEIAMTVVSHLLKKSDAYNVDSTLIAEMLGRRPNELIMIDQVDQLGRWEIGLTDDMGAWEGRQSRINFNSLEVACRNNLIWNIVPDHFDYVDDSALNNEGWIHPKPCNEPGFCFFAGNVNWVCRRDETRIYGKRLSFYSRTDELVLQYSFADLPWQSYPPSTKISSFDYPDVLP